MKHVRVFVFSLLAMFMVAGSAAFASKPAVIWWEFKSVPVDYSANLSTDEILAALEKPKTLILRQGTFPLSGNDEGALGQSLALDDASVWIRNPDGVVSEVELSPDNGTFTLNLPSDLNPGELNGRYLVGVHLDAGVMDLDSDGTNERVHLYSKFLANYRKQGGTKGENPDMFFRDDDKIALEIGPSITKSKFKKAGCPHAGAIKRSKDSNKSSKGSQGGYVRDGGNQSPLKEHKMSVLFKGQALADAEVTILSKSGWKKTIMTDSEGVISITPPKTLARDAGSAGVSHGHGKSPADQRKITKNMEKYRKFRENPEKYRKKFGENMEKYRHSKKGKDSESERDRLLRRLDRRQSERDKLLYVVAYKDPSTGEYHCATLPVSLGMFSRGGWLSESRGFAFWGIVGAGLGVVGVTGGVYRKKRRDRETIFKSKKS